MELQQSPHSQRLNLNRQSVSILTTPPRTFMLLLLARPLDLSLCESAPDYHPLRGPGSKRFA